jgi:transmembrane sensor
VVEAAGRRAVAVGTRYAVRRDADGVRVVVTGGRVRLEGEPGADGHAAPVALLPAGSLATAGRNGVLVRSLPLADVQRYLGWRDGFLAFDDLPLAQAAGEFNRFNARRLELADPAVAQLRVGGNFRWSNVEGFVGLLEQGFPVRAERHPDRIVLHSR